MDDPIIELPENPTKTEVLLAAAKAKNYADELQREVWQWRGMSEKLFDRADEMKNT
jgi:hypothetical protein